MRLTEAAAAERGLLLLGLAEAWRLRDRAAEASDGTPRDQQPRDRNARDRLFKLAPTQAYPR